MNPKSETISSLAVEIPNWRLLNITKAGCVFKDLKPNVVHRFADGSRKHKCLNAESELNDTVRKE